MSNLSNKPFPQSVMLVIHNPPLDFSLVLNELRARGLDVVLMQPGQDFELGDDRTGRFASSALRQAELALQKSQERLDAFFSQSLDGCFFMMLDSPVQWDDRVDKDQTLDYIFAHQHLTEINEAMLTLYGATREQFLGLTPTDFFEHDIAYGKQLWRSLLDQGRVRLESNERKLDGTPIWVEGEYVCLYDDQGRITGHFGIQRDITVRKQAEESTRYAEQKYRSLFEEAPVMYLITVVTDAGPLIADCNELFLSTLGYQRPEVIGRPLADFYTPDSRYELLDASGYQKALKGEFVQQERRFTAKDGRIIDTLLQATPERDAHGQVIGTRAMYVDMTQQRRLEEQLRQAQKLEAVGQLAGGVAHNFNNMLTAIMGYTGLALESTPSDHPLHRDLLNIQAAARRAATLTQQLLAFTRRQTTHPVVVNLNDLTRDLYSMLRHLITEAIDLELVLTQEVGLVHIDPHQLEQVLVNLVLNAQDAMPHGGRLIIETDNIIFDQAYCDRYLDVAPGPYVMLSVTDTGQGIEGKHLKRIFEPFFTTKEVGRGTGLGLATCYGIIKQHHGHIAVYSEVDRGTTFKVYLPRHERFVSLAQKQLPLDVPETLPTGTETILLVEDEPTILEFAARTLRGLGYSVLEATQGRQAIDLALSSAKPLDLLLTDVTMPQMGGDALAIALKTQLPNLKVLFISGYTAMGLKAEMLGDPKMSLLSKPFTPLMLARKVREVLDS